MIMQILRVFDTSTALPDSLPSLAEADKRSRKAECFGELVFAFIDTSPALPDSVPDSSELSPDVDCRLAMKRVSNGDSGQHAKLKPEHLTHGGFSVGRGFPVLR